jgi:SPP1 family predicted phage head-tail adaptor
VLASRLKHRGDIERPVEVRNADGDLERTDWILVAGCVPMEITPRSARDQLIAGSDRSEVSGTIKMRYREDVDSTCRVKRRPDGRVYTLSAPMEDNASGREWITFNVTTGIKQG